MLTLDDTFTQTVNIKKKDSDNIVVPGTVFNIECSDGSTTTVTTDDDGKAMATFDFSVSLADTEQNITGTVLIMMNLMTWVKSR